MMTARKAAPKATGDLLENNLSESIPKTILPKKQPASKTFEAVAYVFLS